MKKIIFTVLSSVAVLGAEAQVQNLYPEFCQYDDWAGYYGGCASVDLNNDGYCDLVIAGFGRKVTNTAGTTDVDRLRMSHVLLIDPKADMLRWKVVNDKKIGFNVTDRPSITPCDINGDGNMDIVAFETTGRNALPASVLVPRATTSSLPTSPLAMQKRRHQSVQCMPT